MSAHRRPHERNPPSRQMSGGLRTKSIFVELDLDEPIIYDITSSGARPQKCALGSVERAARTRKTQQVSGPRTREVYGTKTTTSAVPVQKHTQKLTASSRIALLVLLMALVFPAWRGSNGGRQGGQAEAGVIPRANSPTDICSRWAHQSARVNDTIYIYGGRATTSSMQKSDTWNNNFLTLDMSKGWDISSPSLIGLPQPSGPPAVALGALWHSKDTLYVYGGQFSDSPMVDPLPMSTWQYDIGGMKWTEFANPQTSEGNYSDPADVAVQRAAEGAGLSIPDLGRSYYFGGHLDLHTTEGWTYLVDRVYLKSLLEFTHPGYTNNAIASLANAGAPSDGVYRNITQGGLQEQAAFTERADGVLSYIPGWGNSGVILGLAGGTNETFTEMNVIDVFDIETSEWYKQSTTGTSPGIRVNPCATVFAAPDGSSMNVYLYGGQNLIPAGEQTQYSDMWILSIPSFNWIRVPLDGQSNPPARAGHTCEARDGQIIVIGGYNTTISCDSPGIYVFNATSLSWTNNFVPGSMSVTADGQPKDSDILQASSGYQVPALVHAVIGGTGTGGATQKTPVQAPTAGPFQTGTSPRWTVQVPVKHSSGAKTGAIVAGAIAGVLAILAGYLAFCFWLHHRQLRMYQNHMRMAQRTLFNSSPDGPRESAARESGEKGSGSGGGSVTYGPFGTALQAEQQHRGSHTGSSGHSPSDRLSEDHYAHDGHSPGSIIPGLAPIYTRLEGTDTEYHGAEPALKDAKGSNHPFGTNTAVTEGPAGIHTAASSTDDLLKGQEPSFFQVVLNPRRTLRVVNND